MIDHMTFRIADLERTKMFYEKALAPLGYAAGYDAVHDGARVVGFIKDGKIDTWFIDHSSPLSGPVHIAWVCRQPRRGRRLLCRRARCRGQG